jgi:hypothetical protein
MIWQPINVTSSKRRDRAGMIRDMSERGVLFHSNSHFAVGESVTVMYRIDDRRYGLADGTVVREFRDPSSDNYLFPYVTAVVFPADVELAYSVT